MEALPHLPKQFKIVTPWNTSLPARKNRTEQWGEVQNGGTRRASTGGWGRGGPWQGHFQSSITISFAPIHTSLEFSSPSLISLLRLFQPECHSSILRGWGSQAESLPPRHHLRWPLNHLQLQNWITQPWAYMSNEVCMQPASTAFVTVHSLCEGSSSVTASRWPGSQRFQCITHLEEGKQFFHIVKKGLQRFSCNITIMKVLQVTWGPMLHLDNSIVLRFCPPCPLNSPISLLMHSTSMAVKLAESRGDSSSLMSGSEENPRNSVHQATLAMCKVDFSLVHFFLYRTSA